MIRYELLLETTLKHNIDDLIITWNSINNREFLISIPDDSTSDLSNIINQNTTNISIVINKIIKIISIEKCNQCFSANNTPIYYPPTTNSVNACTVYCNNVSTCNNHGECNSKIPGKCSCYGSRTCSDSSIKNKKDCEDEGETWTFKYIMMVVIYWSNIGICRNSPLVIL